MEGAPKTNYSVNESDILKNELRVRFLVAKKKLEEEQKDNKNVNQLPKEIIMKVDNLNEFRLLMELFGTSEEKIQDILAHENAHGNKADSLGIKGVKHLGYELRIKKTNDGYFLQPKVDIHYPIRYRLLKKKFRQVRKDIISAPEEYGNKLSPNDIETLKKL